MLADPSVYQWIIDSQVMVNTPPDENDGCFGKGLADTAAVLSWLDVEPETIKPLAETYIIGKQKKNGSWNDDPYLTGLCLEALLK